MTKLLMLKIAVFLAAWPSFAANLYQYPESVVFDSLRNCYFASDPSNGYIVQIEENNCQSLFYSFGSNAIGLHLSGDTLFAVKGDVGVYAFDIPSKSLLFSKSFPGQGFLQHLVTDSSGNLYITDSGAGRVYRLHLGDLSASTIATGLTQVMGILFDSKNNRLLFNQWINDSPIWAYDLNTLELSLATSTTLDRLHGMDIDPYGNVYVSAWGDLCVYAFDSTLTSPPELLFCGFDQPGDINFDPRNNELIIPNIDMHVIEFKGVFADIAADTLWGYAPLVVSFGGSSRFDVDSWNWHFGEIATLPGKDVEYTFLQPGQYDIRLEITSGEHSYYYQKNSYVTILADTMTASSSRVEPGGVVECVISARNTIPVTKFTVPYEYLGGLPLALDSFSVAGCRTENFDLVVPVHGDDYNRRGTITLTELDCGQILQLGFGPILKLYFTAGASFPLGKTTTISLDGYLTRIPKYLTPYFEFETATEPGSVSYYICGDPSLDGNVNLIDILFLIDYLYGAPPGLPPTPRESGDVNADGMINLVDILYLIDFLYGNPPGPNPDCG